MIGASIFSSVPPSGDGGTGPFSARTQAESGDLFAALLAELDPGDLQAALLGVPGPAAGAAAVTPAPTGVLPECPEAAAVFPNGLVVPPEIRTLHVGRMARNEQPPVTENEDSSSQDTVDPLPFVTVPSLIDPIAMASRPWNLDADASSSVDADAKESEAGEDNAPAARESGLQFRPAAAAAVRESDARPVASAPAESFELPVTPSRPPGMASGTTDSSGNATAPPATETAAPTRPPAAIEKSVEVFTAIRNLAGIGAADAKVVVRASARTLEPPTADQLTEAEFATPPEEQRQLAVAAQRLAAESARTGSAQQSDTSQRFAFIANDNAADTTPVAIERSAVHAGEEPIAQASAGRDGASHDQPGRGDSSSSALVSQTTQTERVTTTTFDVDVDAGPMPSDEELTGQIVQAAHLQWRNGVGEAKLRLQPEYLGEVVISLRVSAGTVTATLHAAEPEVRAWMHAHESLLKQGLADQGLELEAFVVRDEREERDPSEDRQRESRQQAYQAPRPRTTTAVFELPL